MGDKPKPDAPKGPDKPDNVRDPLPPGQQPAAGQPTQDSPAR